MASVPNSERTWLSRLPTDVIFVIFLDLLRAKNRGISSLESLLKAFPVLTESILLITDHPDKPQLLLRSPVPYISLKAWDRRLEPHRLFSNRLKILSFAYYEFALASQDFTLSLNCLYGRHMNSNTLVLLLDNYGDSYFAKQMRQVATRRDVPLALTITARRGEAMPHNCSLGMSKSVRLKNYHDGALVQTYLRELQSLSPSELPTTLLDEVDKTQLRYLQYLPFAENHWYRHMSLIHPISYRAAMEYPFEPRRLHTYGGIETLRVKLFGKCTKKTHWRPHYARYTIRDLKSAFISFDSCKMPHIAIMEDCFFTSTDRFYRSKSGILDSFTLDNTRWSIQVPRGHPCHNVRDSRGSPVAELLHRVTVDGIPSNLAECDLSVKAANFKLIGLPMRPLISRIEFFETVTLHWWVMAYTRSRNEEPRPFEIIVKTLPKLKELRLFSVVADKEPGVKFTAPLLEELQLVGLVTSEEAWEVKGLLGALPQGLRKVMISQYPDPNRETPIEVRWKDMEFIAPVVEQLAIIGYIPGFALVSMLPFDDLETIFAEPFLSLKRLTLDLSRTLFRKEQATIAFADETFPQLTCLQMVVPRGASHLDLTGELDISVPRHCETVEISSTAKNLIVRVNGFQLEWPAMSSVEGVIYSWVGNDREFERKAQGNSSFQNDWCYEFPLYTESRRDN